MKILRILVAFTLVIVGMVSIVGSGGGGGGGLYDLGELEFDEPSAGTPDTTPPNLNFYDPPDNAAFLDHETTVSLYFNETINPASINNNTFTIRDSSNTRVNGIYQHADGPGYSGTIASFTPSVPLDGNETYQVTVTTDITDTSGNHLQNGANWSFTTGPAGTGQWTPTSDVNTPAPTSSHTAVWTGSEMLVWGGVSYTSTGYRYDPTTDTWTAMSDVNAPSPRSGHTAIWTGLEMIIWGGRAPGASYTWLDDGARYNPATDTWQALSAGNFPVARASHRAVWTGAQMLVWGGRNGGFLPLYPHEGGIYDPGTDTWQAMSTTNSPSGRSGHTAVWTGTHLLIWGGDRENQYFSATGGIYDPQSDTWSAMSMTNAPEARSLHTAVWTGNDMVVWGGYSNNGQHYASGSRYDPLTNTWAATNLADAPLARWGHSAIWSGTEMIVWGGYSRNENSRIGGRYHPGTDTWQYTTTLNAPPGRTNPATVWTGTEMIMWGGIGGTTVDTGGVYMP